MKLGEFLPLILEGCRVAVWQDVEDIPDIVAEYDGRDSIPETMNGCRIREVWTSQQYYNNELQPLLNIAVEG